MALEFMKQVIGVISDTHNLLRPEASVALAGVDLIVHAGDICKPEVLKKLAKLAPLVGVRGNNDKGEWADTLPETRLLELGQTRLYLIHNLKELAIDPLTLGISIIISGHSHKPGISYNNGVMYLNPGSAGPRRFKLPIALALLHLETDRPPEATIIELIETK